MNYKYIVIMRKISSSKTVIFMTPGSGVRILCQSGAPNKCSNQFFENLLLCSWVLIRSSRDLLLSRDNISFSQDNFSFSRVNKSFTCETISRFHEIIYRFHEMIYRYRWTTGVVLPSQKGGGDKNVKETLEVFRDVFSRASAPKVVLRVQGILARTVSLC